MQEIMNYIMENWEAAVLVLTGFATWVLTKVTKGTALKIVKTLPNAIMVLLDIKPEDAPTMKEKFVKGFEQTARKEILDLKEKLINYELKLEMNLTSEQKQRIMKYANEVLEELKKYGVEETINVQDTE